MRSGRLAAAALAAYLLTGPVPADTSLPRLQAAEPVFAKHDIKSRPSICNGFAGYGATVEQTVQMTFIDPLFTIVEDLARLFRPFFSDEATEDDRPRRLQAVTKKRQQSPSKMVKIAQRKRLCG